MIFFGSLLVSEIYTTNFAPHGLAYVISLLIGDLNLFVTVCFFVSVIAWGLSFVYKKRELGLILLAVVLYNISFLTFLIETSNQPLRYIGSGGALLFFTMIPYIVVHMFFVWKCLKDYSDVNDKSRKKY